MTERFQIYQLTVPAVPPGGVRNVPLQLDTDAPFALRWMTSRNIGVNGWNIQTPRKQWQSSELRTDWSVPGDGSARGARGVVFYPNMIYPVGSQIVCDIGNETDETILNARLVLRGVKLYADGAVLAPTYPAQFDTLPFTYAPGNTPSSNQVQAVVSIGLATSATRPASASVVLNVKQSWDFVLRYGVCDPLFQLVEGGVTPPGYTTSGVNFSEVYVMLRDESKKAYMNEPIHINDVFGQVDPRDPNSDDILDYPGDGPNFPGLIVPEIFMPRNTSHYLDILRFDTLGWSVDLNFRLQGATVQPR